MSAEAADEDKADDRDPVCPNPDCAEPEAALPTSMSIRKQDEIVRLCQCPILGCPVVNFLHPRPSEELQHLIQGVQM